MLFIDFLLIDLFLNLSKYFFGFTTIAQIFALSVFSISYSPICFLTCSSRILYCYQNLSETSSLSTILQRFRTSKISFLDSISLILHSFLQIKLKKHEKLSVLVRFKYILHFIISCWS